MDMKVYKICIQESRMFDPAQFYVLDESFSGAIQQALGILKKFQEKWKGTRIKGITEEVTIHAASDRVFP